MPKARSKQQLEDDEDVKYDVRIVWNGHDLSRYCRIGVTYGDHEDPAPSIAVSLSTPNNIIGGAEVSRRELLDAQVTVNGRPYRFLHETGMAMSSLKTRAHFKALLLPQ